MSFFTKILEVFLQKFFEFFALASLILDERFIDKFILPRFLRVVTVVTLISLLVALKETCSPNSLYIYHEQGYIPQECNESKAASKSL